VRVLWIDDYNPMEGGGGSALNDRLLIAEGIRRGHEIIVVTPGSGVFHDYDVVTVHNVYSFDKKVLEKLTEGKPVIFHSHDYNFCRWRLYFPMKDRCRNCKHAKWWRKFLSKCRCVFLSPLHKAAWEFVFGELNADTVPSAIDVNLFKDMKVGREKDSYLAVNPYTFKGADNLVEFQRKHPGKYYWLGTTDVREKFRHWVYLGVKKYEELPYVYSRYEYLLHLPSSPSPFDRVVAEAYLCGMKVITNDLCGFVSWGWKSRDEVRREISRAPDAFWKIVEEVV